MCKSNKQKELLVSQDDLKILFHYDPLTGIFTRLTKVKKHNVGDVAGYIRKDGYGMIYFNKTNWLIHRMAWCYMYGYWPDIIDHIDRNPSNNRIDNLQDGTQSKNSKNRGNQSTNTSGSKGVYKNARLNKWCACIQVDRKSKYLGIFDDKQDAINARKAAELTYGFI